MASKKSLAAVLIAAAVIISVAFYSSGQSKLPKIYYGADICDACGMVIADEAFAAAYYSESKRDWKKFDDIGCTIIAAIKERPELIYVNDYGSGETINARSAYYIHSYNFKSPMGYNIAAFKDKAKAESFGEKLYTFEELLTIYAARLAHE